MLVHHLGQGPVWDPRHFYGEAPLGHAPTAFELGDALVLRWAVEFPAVDRDVGDAEEFGDLLLRQETRLPMGPKPENAFFRHGRTYQAKGE